MGWNDRIEDEGYSAFLHEIVDTGRLTGAAEGITQQVIAKGTASLSEKQSFVFQRHVLDAHVIEECTQCHCPIPWSEMLDAQENDGLCSWCLKMVSNDD